ncbi:MAG: hypothetical protein ACLFVC_07305 [Opitutales bacterium]
MKRLKLERGKEELISTGGNYVCSHILRESAQSRLPENFQSRREGSTSDRDILMTMTGLLSDLRREKPEQSRWAHARQPKKLSHDSPQNS